MNKVRELYAPQDRKFHPNQIVTISDLENFKTDLLLSIKAIFNEGKTNQQKKWLKSYEVKKLLNISTGTLQTLRNSGKLPFSKIGGIIYYDMDDINLVIEQQKRNHSSNAYSSSNK